MEKRTGSAYRARIQKVMEEIRAWEVFRSSEYLRRMRSIARELTDGRFDNIVLYCNPQEQRMGWCNGRKIAVNYGNGVTESFLTLVQKNISLAGILGHECGHKNYSDFALREKYLEGFLEGVWYPYPPEPENAQEEEALEQVKGYLEKRDEDALALVVQVAAYLDNLFEDIYVEEKMCTRFPGSIRRGILLNRGRNVEWIPSLRKLQEEGEDPVSILVNLCAQYALSGRINNWDEEQGELFETFTELMPVIKAGCAAEGKSGRFLAVNQALLKIWKYLYRIIQFMEALKKKKEDEEKENGKTNENEAEEKGEAGKGALGNASGENGDGAEEPEPQSSRRRPEKENGSPEGETGKENGAYGKSTGGEKPASQNGEGKNSAQGTGKEREPSPQKADGKESGGISPDMQEFLNHLAARMPKFVNEMKTEKAFAGFPGDVSWSGVREAKTPEAENPETAAGDADNFREEEKQEKGNGQGDGREKDIPARLVDVDGLLQELLHQMAKKRVDEEINREINLQLQLEMDSVDFEDGHKQVQKKVCREYQITQVQKEQYLKYEEQVKQVQKRLLSTILPILENQGARTERRLFMGRKIDMGSIANPQGAIYSRTYPGKKLDMAVAVLVDISESMLCGRIGPAKLAALCLYEFCRRAKIPVTVYGHHTDGYGHRRLEDEIVYLHSCAEFEPDKNDRYRIAALHPDGANRDGVALKFMGQKLLKRTEKQKLLVLISDGLPNSNRYKGEMAKKDLCAIKKGLTGKGIVFLAAAIGADKEKIREIYREAFLDISDVEKLPVMLTKQVLKYVRR